MLGAPEGDVKDLPAAPHFLEGWNIGQPDQVFDYGSDFYVPAQGVCGVQIFRGPNQLH